MATTYTADLPATADCRGRALPVLGQTILGTMREWYDAFRVIPTSNVGDAGLIRAWLAYHRGLATATLSAVAPSRGHTWKVNTRGSWERVRIVDYYDHRAGVVPIEGGR